MKRKLPLAAATALACLSTTAMAQGYVAVDAGRTRLDGVCVPGPSCAGGALAYRVVAGFELGDGFSFEAGFLNLGKVTASSASVSRSAEMRALQVGGAYEWALGRYLALVGRVGAEYQHGTTDDVQLPAQETSTKSNGASAYGGVGGIVTLARHVRLQAGIEWSKADFLGTSSIIRSTTAGLRYEF